MVELAVPVTVYEAGMLIPIDDEHAVERADFLVVHRTIGLSVTAPRRNLKQLCPFSQKNPRFGVDNLPVDAGNVLISDDHGRVDHSAGNNRISASQLSDGILLAGP